MVEDVSRVGGPADKAPDAIDPVAGKTVAEILGEIVWLMTQDPAGREMKVSEIESLVMPAILQKRFHIKYAQVPDVRRTGAPKLQPVLALIKHGTEESIIVFSLMKIQTT
jgi:hypothetical protein